MAINWRERFVATAIHFVVTLFVAGLAAAVIFLVWFPNSMAAMVGGTSLFLLVFTSDLVLGPLLSLVVYSSKKSRLKLIIDYSVIAAAQLTALIYGVFVVAESRPVFVAFDVDRMEIVTAIEIEDEHLAEASDERFRSRSWLGPKLVAVVRPTNNKEKSDLAFLAIAGKDAEYLPKYYHEYETAREQILAKSLSLQVLLEGSDTAKSQIDSAVKATGKSSDDLRWLLVRHRFGFGIGLIDAKSAMPLKYLPIDPTWVKGDHAPYRGSIRVG
jgi:hypothetical protein